MTSDVASDRNQAQSIIQRAARATARDGWRTTTTGLLFHGGEGHWGRIDAIVGVALDSDFEAAARLVFPSTLVDAARPAFGRSVPIQLFAGGELLGSPNRKKALAATNAMLQMKKIVIADLQ